MPRIANGVAVRRRGSRPSVAVRPRTYAMTRSSLRLAAPLALLGATLFGMAEPAAAQYFGRNKVQYERFEFRILRTPHFDEYFYPAESLVVPKRRKATKPSRGQKEARLAEKKKRGDTKRQRRPGAFD